MKENRRRHVLQDPLRSHQTVQKTTKTHYFEFLSHCSGALWAKNSSTGHFPSVFIIATLIN